MFGFFVGFCHGSKIKLWQPVFWFLPALLIIGRFWHLKCEAPHFLRLQALMTRHWFYNIDQWLAHTVFSRRRSIFGFQFFFDEDHSDRKATSFGKSSNAPKQNELTPSLPCAESCISLFKDLWRYKDYTPWILALKWCRQNMSLEKIYFALWIRKKLG